MRLAAVVVQLMVIVVLAMAGLHKIPGHRRFAATLTGLGVPRRRAPAVGAAAIGAELAMAGALPYLPGPFQGTVVLAFGAAFGVVGLVALRRRLHLPCACLGRLSGPSELGRRQLVALPLWVSAAVVLAAGASPAPAEVGLERLAVGLTAVAVLTVVPLVPLVHRARGDRRAMQGVVVAAVGAGR